MTANETGNAPDFHAMINTSAGNKSHHDGAIAEMPAPYDPETLERFIGEVKPLVDAG